MSASASVPQTRGGLLAVKPPETRGPLSAKAQALGLETREDVEKEFKAAKTGWSAPRQPKAWWHCPFCNKEFWSPSGARKHMKTQGHPVLRWDWY